jgi:hypothetical protein
VGEHGRSRRRQGIAMSIECGEIDESDYRKDFGICNRCYYKFRLGQVCPKCRNPEFRLIPKKRAAAKIAARKANAMKSSYGHRDRKRKK